MSALFRLARYKRKMSDVIFLVVNGLTGNGLNLFKSFQMIARNITNFIILVLVALFGDAGTAAYGIGNRVLMFTFI